MGRLVVGLDIGVTSVGYGVIDIDSGEFVDYGVRLFEEGTAENNEKRRGARGRRRLVRRKKTRLSDMQKLLKEIGIMSDDYKPLNNIYEIRKKGLNGKLSNDELTAALLHLTKHRGSSIETVEEDDAKAKDAEKTKAILLENGKALASGKYICEIQLDKLNSNGKVRGITNNFKTKDYINEARQILSNQDLNNESVEKIINIISRKRAYYEGPGSEKSPTPYGQWYMEDGELKHIGLIEKMKGKCSIYPNEYRAPKMCVSAELFNFLNDLNNMSIEDEPLDISQKEDIIKIVSEKGTITFKALTKLIKVSENDISGYRIDKNEKPLLTEFKGYKELKKVFKAHNIDVSLKDYELLDSISQILTDEKGIDRRKNKLKELNLTDAVIHDLIGLTKFTGYHSLSLKAIRELNTELYKTSSNQMQLLHELEMFDKNRVSTKGKVNIEADYEAILSPVAKRSQNEAIKVVNALRHKYGELDSVVIEMTRSKNSADEKKRINEIQKRNEANSKKIDTLLKDAGFDPDKVKGKVKQKISLYEEQEGKSAYTGEYLDLRRIINDETYTEIDHIIPLSVSLDDSQTNKVLITRTENQKKGNLTPLMAIRRGKFPGLSEETYKSRILSMKNIPYKKRNNLLDERDITKYDVIKEFINRNLVDTSYACRTVLNTLQNYYKDNEIDTKVYTINGHVTNFFRKQIQLNKNRDADNLHHAIDALIVASVKKLNLLDTYLSKYTFDHFYNEETGEIIQIPEEKEYLNYDYIRYIVALKSLYEESRKYYQYLLMKNDMHFAPIKISYKIDTKPNRKVADETIYSTRTTENGVMLTTKIKDIYANESSNIKMINGIINGESKLLMKEKDPQTYAQIEEIVLHHFKEFKDNSKFYKLNKGKYELVGENPLTAYKNDFGPIHKYSKKGNGPEIVSARVYEEKLGNHQDISRNYNVKDKKVIIKQLSPYRTDFYLCSDGKYKFVTVKYNDIHFEKSINKYVINKEWYKNQLELKGITDKDKFQFSLHHHELVNIQKKQGSKFVYDESQENRELQPMLYDGTNYEILKFTATNDDKTNVFEVNPRYKSCKKQLRVTVSTMTSMKKYATDVLGNLYEVTDNKLKLEFE